MKKAGGRSRLQALTSQEILSMVDNSQPSEDLDSNNADDEDITSGMDANYFLLKDLADAGMDDAELLFENSPPHSETDDEINVADSRPNSSQDNPDSFDGVISGQGSKSSDDDVVILHPTRLISSSPVKKRLTKNNGRPKSSIWEDFIMTLENGKRITRCKWCNKRCSAKADRLKVHKDKCNAARPRVTKRSIFLGGSNALATVSAPESESEPVTPKATMRGFLDSMSQGEKDAIDQKCADFIFSKNIPFDTVQNEKFREFCQILRPSYKLPDRFQIGGRLLDNAYNEKLSEVRKAIAGKKVTVMQDGWSTVQNDPLIVHAISDGKRTVFVNAVATEDNVKNAEYCLKLLKEAIKYAEETFGVQIIGCVTDNCSTMNLLRSELHKENPELFVYGCNTHLLNLIGRDMSKVMLTEKIKSVQRHFRNHHFESASLKLMKGLRPVLPGDTRWNSQIAMFQNYEKNHATYLQISRKPKSGIEPGSELFAILNDGKAYTEVGRMIRKLEPIKISLNTLQKDDATCADAVHEWVTLLDTLVFDDLDENKMVKKRFKKAVPTPALCAYMLHPKYRGTKLSMKQLESGRKWLAEKNPYYFVIFSSLQAKDEAYFPRTMMDDTVISSMDPCSWWKSISKSSDLIGPGFVDLADSLLRLPASTSGLERSLSNLGRIQCKERCKLGIEKASKLCFISFHS